MREVYSDTGLPQERKISKQSNLSRAVVPNLFDNRDRFHGRQFFHGLGVGGMVQVVMQAMGGGR